MHILWRRSRCLLLTILLCCLALVFTACQRPTLMDKEFSTQQQTGSQTSSDQAAAHTLAQATQAIRKAAMPETQTTCPAAGQARPAVMKPMASRRGRTLVYIYNEMVPHATAYGHLKRYDAATRKKSEIVRSGSDIQWAQVSADGQWVLFLSTPDQHSDPHHSAMLQLVRVDGQGLQTLYCFPAVAQAAGTASWLRTNVQWSPDQQFALISADIQAATSTISLLEMKSGKVRTILSDRKDEQYGFTALTWLDASRAYVVKAGRSGPLPPMTLYLLNVNSSSKHLQPVLTHQVRMSELSMDSSLDASKLFVSYCLEAASPFDTLITVGAATGGVQQPIYHQAPTVCAQTMRVISATKLLLLVQLSNAATETHGNQQIWLMGAKGGAHIVLATLPVVKGQQVEYDLNSYTQYLWSNVARDGSMYALQSTNFDTKEQKIFVAPLAGGVPIQVAATSQGSVKLVGWSS